MTSPSVPICEACSRLRSGPTGEGYACDAFPDGIPDIIYIDGYDHRNFYPGDRGIRFDLDPARANVLAVYERHTLPNAPAPLAVLTASAGRPARYIYRLGPDGPLRTADAVDGGWDGVAYCVELGCRRPATHRRIVPSSDGDVYELVCEAHDDSAPENQSIRGSDVSGEVEPGGRSHASEGA